ncbi:MAG: 30S ribosomal protein S17e [Candidatus Aenigmarchaeota archaeon]|nr:30S ribosomal protein S17e [Candidatus Aenigmarchaeota archaeon]
MGRIRTHDVKDVVNDLLDKHQDRFSDSFEKNKEVINALNISQSKRHRNRIAGYMTRSFKNRKKRPQA